MTAPGGAPPVVVWSVAGTDSGGGAGLTADQRAVDAFGGAVHFCPVVAAVTAQNSRAVTHIEPMPAALIEAQLQALAGDMPPAAVKTGLLGSVEAVHAVARRIDRLRAEHGPVALVVDPVLAASSGARFADREVLAAYRGELLPRATLVTPNRREALALLGDEAMQRGAADGGAEACGNTDADRGTDAGRGTDRRDGTDIDTATVPQLARALRRLGAAAVCITGGDGHDAGGTQSLDWLDGAHAAGWLASPRLDTPHNHGTGCTFASSAAAALALGFVAEDAVVLAKMSTLQALRHGRAAGAGAGPVHARPGFASDPTLLPTMSWGEVAAEAVRFPPRPPAPVRSLGLYAVVDSTERVAQVLAAGIRTVQLRMKTPDRPDAAWHAALRLAVQASVAACREAGAELFVNDHWRLARELGAGGVHLGQEDLLALSGDGRRELRASGLALGISSHSLWELCRARSLAPRYVACGPVWPTLTKAMPWRAQGLDNLAWWRRMAGAPVVAIGGILEAGQVEAAARCGVDGVCVVRALGDDPETSVPALEAALRAGRAGVPASAPTLPQPSLDGRHSAARSRLAARRSAAVAVTALRQRAYATACARRSARQ